MTYRIFSEDRVNDITKFSFSLLICFYIQSMTFVNKKISNNLTQFKIFLVFYLSCLFTNLANPQSYLIFISLKTYLN